MGYRGERILAARIVFPKDKALFFADPVQSDRQDRWPFSRDELYVCSNGIDLLYTDSRRPLPFLYEDACFVSITSNEENPRGALIIGPHFIDNVFDREFPGLKRPDAIRFDTSDPKMWIITHMYEFKSGKTNGSVKKLLGFSTLLSKMREDAASLLNALRKTLPPTDLLPDSIVVPPDEDISVIFVSPRMQNGSIFFQDVPRFQVTHQRVPAA